MVSSLPASPAKDDSDWGAAMYEVERHLRDADVPNASIVDAGLRLSASGFDDRISASIVYAESLEENNVSEATLNQLEADVFFSISGAF